MGLFKEYKDDFLQAVNELVPGDAPGDEPVKVEDLDLEVDTLGGDLDVETEFSKLDGLLEQVKEEVVTEKQPESIRDNVNIQRLLNEEKAAKEAAPAPVPTPVAAPTPVPAPAPAPIPAPMPMDLVMPEPEPQPIPQPQAPEKPFVSDETSLITAGTVISGDIQATGALDVQGAVNGNVTCNGKLVVTGSINGNSSASEFFADGARIEGEVNTNGTIKVGAGTIIIGNLSATSAVIAGAVKGDIDVQGPVVIDASAVIMGNIKSRSVQINNGAIIEGFCSQCYSDTNVADLFAKR